MDHRCFLRLLMQQELQQEVFFAKGSRRMEVGLYLLPHLLSHKLCSLLDMIIGSLRLLSPLILNMCFARGIDCFFHLDLNIVWITFS